MHFINNPIEHIMLVFDEMYPEISNRITLEFQSQEYINKLSKEDTGVEIAYGVCYFSKETDDINIYLSSDLGIYEISEVLCHELSHAVCGYEADHNEEFHSTFETIQNTCLDRMTQVYKDLFGEDVKLRIVNSKLDEIQQRDGASLNEA